MSLFSPAWTPTPTALHRGGAAVLWGGLALALALLFLLLWKAPAAMPLLPALAVVGVAVPFLLRRPLFHLCFVLAFSGLALEHRPEIQVGEVLFGLYANFYLATWFFDQLVRRRNPIFTSFESRVLLGFLLYIAALVPLSFFHGATPYTVVRELHALSMLGFFFPIREACRTERNAARFILGVGAALTVFVVFRNLVNYQSAINNSDQLIGVIQGRVIANDHILCAASLFTFVFLLHSTSARKTAVFIGLFLLSFTGLLLTLGRAFWASFALGVAFLFLLVDWRLKGRILFYGTSAAIPLLAIGLIFFGDYVTLFLQGLLERLTSVEGSATRDVSLVGRFTEAAGAWARIKQNPILGHGVGVPFTYNNIIWRVTATTTFVHIGYVYLWYAFGILGGVLMLVWWWRSFYCGLMSYWKEGPLVLRLGGLGAAATLVAFTLSATTSNPFWHLDYLLGLAYVMGLACGAHARLKEAPAGAPA